MPSPILLVMAAGFSLLPASAPRAAAPDASPPATANKPTPDLAEARIHAARKVYQLLATDYRLGWRPWSEPVYRWSVRWLDSERDRSPRKEDQLAALKAHLQRMRELEAVAKARFRRQDTTVDEATSTEYYRLEAQAWLEKANRR